MATVQISSQTVMCTLVNTEMEDQKAMDSTSGPTEINTPVNSKKAKSTEKENGRSSHPT
jgi:hypothetical protein